MSYRNSKKNHESLLLHLGSQLGHRSGRTYFTMPITFPPLPPSLLQSGLGPYSFIIFSCICLLTVVYIWLSVPETKGKTFLEVCQMFAKRNKVEIKLGDGELPLKERKESLEDAVRVTAF